MSARSNPRWLQFADAIDFGLYFTGAVIMPMLIGIVVLLLVVGLIHRYLLPRINFWVILISWMIGAQLIRQIWKRSQRKGQPR